MTFILLGKIAERSDSSNLEHLQHLINGLHSLTQSQHYSSCSRQLRISKTLYVLAANYIQIKARRHSACLIGNQSTDLYICCPRPVKEMVFAPGNVNCSMAVAAVDS
jgi:hypothetical protein